MTYQFPHTLKIFLSTSKKWWRDPFHVYKNVAYIQVNVVKDYETFLQYLIQATSLNVNICLLGERKYPSGPLGKFLDGSILSCESFRINMSARLYSGTQPTSIICNLDRQHRMHLAYMIDSENSMLTKQMFENVKTRLLHQPLTNSEWNALNAAQISNPDLFNESDPMLFAQKFMNIIDSI